jgi:hypothetical protein
LSPAMVPPACGALVLPNPLSQKRPPGKVLCGKLDAVRVAPNSDFHAGPACRGWQTVKAELY